MYTISYSYIVVMNLFLQLLPVANVTLYCVYVVYFIVCCSVLLHFRFVWCSESRHCWHCLLTISLKLSVWHQTLLSAFRANMTCLP